MLTCQEVTAKASAMLDGELGFRDRIAVRGHLLMCVNCRRFAKQFSSLVGSMALRSEAQAQSTSLEYVDRVMQSLESAQAPFSDPRGPDRE